MNITSKYESPNSFYRLGDIDILTFSQDELSKLWKFYLSTTEHYVVSREFDKSKGMYANAPEEVIRRGLMDFSASLIGQQLSIFAVMDMFIDRCFDDRAFNPYTEKSAWLCIDTPSYEEMEEITSVNGNRILWANSEGSCGNKKLEEDIHRILYKTPNPGSEREELIASLMDDFKNEGITSVYLNKDGVMENIVMDGGFDGIPIFIGEFTSKNGEEFFKSFKYIGR